MKRDFILGLGVLAGVLAVIAIVANNPIKEIACTMEVKICPDGSAAGRTGSNCEFAKCPDVQSDRKIVVYSPAQNTIIKSPLTIIGKATGSWFFEASFPIKIIDNNGNEVAKGHADAKGNWMTTDFVPFEAELTFETPETDMGTIILKKDNPSDIPERNDSISIPIRFSHTNPVTGGGVMGSIKISPTCPVERDPPDPKCAPKGYETSVKINRVGSLDIIALVKSGADGAFKVSLSPGTYDLVAGEKTTMPICNSTVVEVKSGEFTTVEISCDSGIR